MTLNQPINIPALKEWSSVVDALSTGEQTILLRKGGLRDGRGGFVLRAQRFLLFPTEYHLPGNEPPPAPHAEVHLRVFAEAVAQFPDISPDEAAAIQERNWCAPEYVARRLEHQPKRQMTLILLRTFLLNEPQEIPRLPEHGGCASWLTLALPRPLGHITPVLTDDAWHVRVNALETLLGRAGSEPVISER